MEASGGGGGIWSEEKLRLSLKSGSLTAWELIELLGTGYFSKGLSHHTLSMGIGEVFQELILDVLKQVRPVAVRNETTSALERPSNAQISSLTPLHCLVL